jgi:hypothetical protein
VKGYSQYPGLNERVDLTSDFMKAINNRFICKSLPLLLMCLLLLSHCHKTAEKQNDDILALLIDKPDQLEFIECKEGSGQIVLEAKYRVSGTHGQLIEELLHKESGMNRLQFNCCGWESHPDGNVGITEKFNKRYRKPYNYTHILVSMYSEETDIQDRGQWHTIPYFYVVVQVVNV